MYKSLYKTILTGFNASLNLFELLYRITHVNTKNILIDKIFRHKKSDFALIQRTQQTSYVYTFF